MPNRLADETSPYLLQHAHNPVDWYPWGADAFALARHEDKPILLSVGYAACHWCHVMERESFEDEATAALMNELFVNIKVDREERPDVDSIYMQAVQAMLGHGGWPMTVFLTPELEPFWGGTYFPPRDRPGMPSFQRVLRAVRAAYDQQEDEVRRVADSMREMYAHMAAVPRHTGALSAGLLERARDSLLSAHDAHSGGFGSAPKFPHAMAMDFLLTQWARHDHAAALAATHDTFLRMARGGLYDQLGGGFARYSVDERWLVPHFEKMLYDNALLTRVGVHLWQASGDVEVRRVVRDTIDWVAREMTSPEGGFYSTLDADSEGEEGRFYVWDEAELRAALGADADAAIAYWGVTPQGNFEGRNILHVADAERARDERIERARAKLLEARGRRVRPARDEKVLASWNGLMLRAIADAARAFDDDRYLALARRAGEFAFDALVRDDRVLRTFRDGRSRIAGFLEDYAALALGALSLYEATFDDRWLERAARLGRAAVRWFRDGDVFFDTASDAEPLLARPRDVTDNATPSGTSLTAELLLRLGALLGDDELTRLGRQALAAQMDALARHPLAFGHALCAADLAVHGAVAVAIVGRSDDDALRALARAAGSVYVPSRVVAGTTAGTSSSPALLRDRVPIDGQATAYVCRGFACDAPVTDATRLVEQLRRASRATPPSG